MSEGGRGVGCLKMDGPALFFREDARRLLQNKTVILVGDSNMRTVYMDSVVLVQEGRLCFVKEFQKRVVNDMLEQSFKGDTLVTGAKASHAREFQEVRHYAKLGVDITYAFVSKCWPNYFLQDLFKKIEKGETKKPDMVVMCSMLWDVSRYGPHGANNFKKSVNELCVQVKRFLDPGTFLWMTNPPVGNKVTAGFLLEELDFLGPLVRFHVKEANDYSMDVMEKHGIDGLDLCYYMADLTDLRDSDAIHWTPAGVRLMTSVILTHLCLLWGIEPPKFDKQQYELVKDINYEYLLKNLAGLVQKESTPEWLEAMFQKEPRLKVHVGSFAKPLEAPPSSSGSAGQVQSG